MEEALMIAEHSIASSRVAVNPAPTNERQTQTMSAYFLQDSTEPPLEPHISFIENIDDAEVKYEFVACETGFPDVIVNGTYEGKLVNFEYDMPDSENTSEDSEDDDDVPIPTMMSAPEYRANQIALQKKAALAKHNA